MADNENPTPSSPSGEVQLLGVRQGKTQTMRALVAELKRHQERPVDRDFVLVEDHDVQSGLRGRRES